MGCSTSSPAPKTGSAPKSDKTIVYVLGGPGSGKGTQCAKLVAEFGFVHLSAGDLLRAEVARGGERANTIDHMMKEGAIVPKEVTIELLREAIAAKPPGTLFLIDGFPRAVDQAEAFEKGTKGDFCLFFECTEEELERRLLHRGQTSGRVDDNIESIKKRFATFKTQSLPVLEIFEKDNRLEKIDSTKTVDEVYETTKGIVTKRLGDRLRGGATGTRALAPGEARTEHSSLSRADVDRIMSALPTGDSSDDKHKRDDLFNRIDVNGNKKLSLAEVDKGVRDVLQVDALFDAKPVIMRAFQASKGAFQGKPGAVADDDYVSRSEFGLLLRYLKHYFELWVMFDKIDKSQDRRVSEREFTAALPQLQQWGAHIKSAHETFTEIDANHGGSILFDEFSAWAIKNHIGFHAVEEN